MGIIRELFGVSAKTRENKVSLRKKIANSKTLNRAVIGTFAGYLRMAHATTHWDVTGKDELDAALAQHGSVILVLWHQRIAYSPFMFPSKERPILSITSNARAGRLAGQIQAAFGFQTVAFSSKRANLSASRQVIKLIRDGASIGVAADGPRGPARELKTVPLEWARATGKPIVLVTFSVKRFWTWGTWDALMFPWPFNRGRMAYQRWDQEVPRRFTPPELEALRDQLERDLDNFVEAIDFQP